MERFGSPSRRVFSARSIITFVLAVVVTALLWVTIGSQPAHAADASWSGEAIVYDGHGFNKTTDFQDNSNAIPEGATIYQTPVQTASNGSKKVFIIYFTSGVDPPLAETAKYVELDYSSDKTTSNPSNTRDISLTKQGEESEISSCSVGGIGWIVCPVSVFFAEAMDNIFKILAGMIAVQPSVLGDQNNSMYIAWNVMRNIANVAFVIAFLIIIYSQLTNIGVSNYGLKKLIPRLIIAAILVNVSFIISAIAIDISNILGYSIQEVFNTIREDTFHLTNDNFAGVNDNPWTAVTGVILAGGGVVGGTYFVASGGLYLLVPLLLGLLLTIIFVVIVLAARQAIIVILVIIAPIAFTANLLPNTEKWFDKWKDLFFTMLIFFPAFSLVFGGSQLAGQLIIQSAGDSIVTVLFGMAVQIAPLVITPLILRFSGGLLGRIAQLANNPNKGMLDRSKNWANGRAEMKKYENLSKYHEAGKKTPWWNPGLKTMEMFDNSGRKTKDRTELYKLRADNKYHSSDAYEKIHGSQAAAELDKTTINSELSSHIERQKVRIGTDLNMKNIRAEEAKLTLDVDSARTTRQVEEFKAGRVATPITELNNRMVNMQANTARLAAEKQGAQAAQYIQQRNLSETMTATSVASVALQRVAGGVDPNGIIRAQANAIKSLSSLEKDALDNSVLLLNSEAVKSNDTLKGYSDKLIQEVLAKQPHSYSPQIIEAAFEAMAQDGQINVLRQARMSDAVDQSMLTKLFARNATTMKVKGGFDLQANPNLALATPEQMNVSIAGTIGDVSANNIANLKAGFWEKTSNEIGTIITDVNKHVYDPADPVVDAKKREVSRNNLKKAYRSVTEALKNDDVRAGLGDRLDETIKIHKALHREFGAGNKDMEVDYSQFKVK